MVVNPFASGEGQQNGVPVPDGDARKVLIQRMSGRTNFAGSTATSGIIQLVGLNGAAGTTVASVNISYGNDATNVSLSMTNSVQGTDTSSQGLTIISASSGTFKMLAAAIRVNASGIDTESGWLRGGNSPIVAQTTAVPAFNGNSWFVGALETTTFGIKDGITVRRRCPRLADWVGVTPQASYYSTSNNVYGDMPFIIFNGLSTTTILNIEWVYWLEVEPYTASVPIALTIPGYSEELDALIYQANVKEPLVAKGHSFASFFKGMWKGVRDVGKYVWKKGLKTTVDKTLEGANSKLDRTVSGFFQ
jgi:hypothetical protein